MGSCGSGPSTGSGQGFSRELLLLLLPLRRQGEAGRGCSRFESIPKAPLPNPPLPSQGREQGLAASRSHDDVAETSCRNRVAPGATSRCPASSINGVNFSTTPESTAAPSIPSTASTPPRKRHGKGKRG